MTLSDDRPVCQQMFQTNVDASEYHQRVFSTTVLHTPLMVIAPQRHGTSRLLCLSTVILLLSSRLRSESCDRTALVVQGTLIALLHD